MHLTFWQPIPSFHQQGFLNLLAQADWVDSVSLKYERELPASFKQSGWPDPVWKDVEVAPIEATDSANPAADQIHFFTGFNTHKCLWKIFHKLPKSAQCRVFAFAEAPALYGWRAPLRRIKYKIHAHSIGSRLDGVLALGEKGVHFYREQLGCTCPVHQFAYYDLPLADFPQPVATPPHDETNLLYVGRLIHLKGLDRLFRALARISSQSNWQLSIVGDGPEKSRLKSLAVKLGIQDQLHWHGGVQANQVGSYYQTADYLLQPSRGDGWGMTIPEALRYGCDVIATDACGAADLASPNQRLPSDTAHWPKILRAAIEKGPLTEAQRTANRTRAKTVSAEAGVARLKQVLF